MSKDKEVRQKIWTHAREKAEYVPWQILCVDLIGPYKIKCNGKSNLLLWCVTMIDPATGWFEMARIVNKEPITVANMVEQTWLTRYPWPKLLITIKDQSS